MGGDLEVEQQRQCGEPQCGNWLDGMLQHTAMPSVSRMNRRRQEEPNPARTVKQIY